MKKGLWFLVVFATLFVFGTGIAVSQNSSVVFNMVFGDTAELHCPDGVLTFTNNTVSDGYANCDTVVILPTPTPTIPIVTPPIVEKVVNIPYVPGLSGSADLNANNRAIVWGGEVSPNGSYFDSRFIFNPEGLRIRWQAFDQNVIAGDEIEFSINGRVFTSSVTSNTRFTVGTRCTGSLNCRGWDVTTAQPISYSELGISPTVGLTMPLAIKFTDVDSYTQNLAEWSGVAVVGDVASPITPVGPVVLKEFPIAEDAPVGGGTDCGAQAFPDYFPTWGDDVWINYPYANIQAQWDAADWPCYSKYAMNVTIPEFEGRNIVKTAIELKQFGNAGYTYGDTATTVVQTFLLSDTIKNGVTTWDNLPQALRLLSRTQVDELPVECNFYCNPGLPHLFDITGAKDITKTFGVVLYTAAGQYHSGKYFGSVFGAEKPVLKVWYEGDVVLPTPTPTATATEVPTDVPTATSTPTPVPTATATSTPTPLPTNTPTPTPTNTPLPTATSTPSATVACNWYVSPTGSDLNPGSSTLAPLATFNKAWTKVLPGQTLCLMDGIYKQTLNPNVRNGTATQPITVRALNDGKAIVDGEGVRVPVKLGDTWPGPIGEYFVIEGIVAKNSSESVWEIYGDNNVLKRTSGYNANTDTNDHVYFIWADNNVIDGCIASGTGRNMLLIYQGSNNRISNCVALWTQWDGRDFCSVQYPNGNNVVIYNASNNIVENTYAVGKAAGRGILIQANNDNVRADGNKVLGGGAVYTGKDLQGNLMNYGSRPVSSCGGTEISPVRAGGLAGLAFYGQGSIQNNLWENVFSYGNAGLGFSNLKPFTALPTAGNVINKAKIKANGSNLVYEEGPTGNSIHPNEMFGVTVNDSWIEGSVYQSAGFNPNAKYANGVLTAQPAFPLDMESRFVSEQGYSISTFLQNLLAN